MRTFLFNCYTSKTAKKPFISAISEGWNEDTASLKLIGKKEYKDSNKTIEIGTIRKVELVHEII